MRRDSVQNKSIEYYKCGRKEHVISKSIGKPTKKYIKYC